MRWELRKTLIRGLLGGLALLCGDPARAQDANAPRITVLGHTFPAYSGVAASRMAVADLDGDGRADFVYGATAGQSSLLFVTGARSNGSLGVKQSLIMPTSSKLVRVLAASSIGDERVYALAKDGLVTAYGGWPLRELRTFQVLDNATAAAIGDINADGRDELVVVRSGRVLAYALGTGEQQWETLAPTASADIVLAQLDADPALEIVLGSDWFGVVLDGATGALEGTAEDGFGRYVAAGRFGPDTDAQIVGSLVAVFEGGPSWIPRWTYNVSYGVSALTSADLDGDGRDEILFGALQHQAGVHVIDAITRQERFAIAGQDYGISAIGVGDVDGDGTTAVAFSSSASSTDGRIDSRWRLVDARTGADKLQLTSRHGRYGIVALGDVDGDGRLEQVVGPSIEGARVAFMQVADAHSGELKWESEGRDSWNVRAIALGQLAGPSVDMVIGGRGTWDGSILVVDGVSHAVRLSVGGPIDSVLRGRSVEALALLDYDHDEIPDIVAATRAVTTAAAGAKLHVYSGVTGQLLTETQAMGAESETVGGLLLGGAKGDAWRELILTLSDSVRGFDSATLQPAWTLPVRSIATRYLAHGLAGPELLLLREDSRLAFHDARTRSLLRTLPAPAGATAVLALDDAPEHLLVAAGGRLHLLDGLDGSVRASSDYLGTALAQGNQLVAAKLGRDVWQIASGGDAGYFRHRLELSERVFSDGFESGPPP